ncbi:glycosyltransferase family 4 protein [Candidatus Margulisiibacteriota bacterium]
MKIAMIAPPFISVPPQKYGGTELVIYNLIEELEKLGHTVYLFANKESKASCELFSYWNSPKIMDLAAPIEDKEFVHELCIKYAYVMAEKLGVDIIHDHTLTRNTTSIPTITTLHGPAADTIVDMCHRYSCDAPHYFVSISERQQKLFLEKNSDINFAGTVHNGVETELFPFNDKKEDFILFMGRVNWEKGLDAAIRIATQAKEHLSMCIKKEEDFEIEFFDEVIQPSINTFPKDLRLGIHENKDRKFLVDQFMRAKCTLFTSQWEEPFGLVMIESMLCGTPVIAFNRGAAPEVIRDGVTGFIVESEEEMVEALKKVDTIDPQQCRDHVIQHFSREVMADRYARVYEEVIAHYRGGSVERLEPVTVFESSMLGKALAKEVQIYN